MSDATISQLTSQATAFRDERDWKQYHNAKDMALSLMLEAAELAEITQWRNGADLEKHLDQQREHVGQELSDVLYWVLLMASDLKIDLPAAFAAKMHLNAMKYPAEKARGVATKYTQL